MNKEELQRKAVQIRQDIIREIYHSGSGHPGGSLSATDIMVTLYFNEMNFNSKDPKDPTRDKFVLSKGHAAPALYACLAEIGYFPKEELLTLRKIGSNLQGHPSMLKTPGVEISTGSLGHGISAAVGMAIANRLDKKESRVYSLLGDGELQEGMVWEAFMAAAHFKLDNLCAIIDHNGLQIDGKNDDVMTVMPIAEKLLAFEWNVIELDGHDIGALLDGFSRARAHKGQPTMIVAETHKGKGVSFMEDQVGWHGKAPNEEQAKQAMQELRGIL
jgi:transketolase